MTQTVLPSFSLRDLLCLIKWRIALLATLSAFAGYRVASPEPFHLLPFFGVFFLAAAAGSGNQIQEIQRDRLFSRTKDRPLAAGRMHRVTAMVFSLLSLFAGILLLLPEGPVPLVLGLFCIVIYNGVYTPLKPHTGFALVIGLFCGMLPPLMGAAMACGTAFVKSAFAIAVLIGVWQVPHTWSIFLFHEKEYRKSPYPTPFATFSEPFFPFVTCIWTAAYACILLTLPLFGNRLSPLHAWLLAGISLATLLGTGTMAQTGKTCRLAPLIRFSLAAALCVITFLPAPP